MDMGLINILQNKIIISTTRYAIVLFIKTTTAMLFWFFVVSIVTWG